MTTIEQVCEQVRETSRGLGTWVRKYSDVYEDSLTDRLLYELSESPLGLFSKKFTRHQESRESGADWDWWFVLRGGAIGFRFQAKKVISGVDHYQRLARANSAGLQIKLLLESARTDNLLAFYALYSQGIYGSNTMCGGAGQLINEGVFLAEASTLCERFIDPGKSLVEARDLLGCSNPLSCLFCCPMIWSLEDGYLGAFYHYAGIYYSGFFRNGNNEMPGFHAKLPPHILSLLQFRDRDIPSWWEKEYQNVVHNTKAIAVLDLRSVDE